MEPEKFCKPSLLLHSNPAMTLKPLHSDLSLGMFLVTSWLNTILYTSQVALSIYYLYHFATTRWLRCWILASLFIDGVCSIANLAGTYMYLVINHGPSLTVFTLAAETAILLTYTSALITHVFFCHRYWTM
ncbi:uncharacterized protein EV420DRAFT_412544 [Desarmillaria tabescens]|uniref:Uncharacterized protein n=1 Tax=Armillaria tabescens TaxID=1929756 RepID=A0AA39KBK4_ARMTA|nr:uncharacterized protein EV420DRAFT_412544 [Desarmillaria tabescens]KAK0458080.1 hypothetical protein EV420DRAFT_412544 [Desarmillaria tabescens]